MCGIAGYIQKQPDHATLDAMLKRMVHRGPDGEGTWHGNREGWHVALGHRRLSIIDLEGGKQPLGNEDGSVQITFNGEIYNFQALRERLETRGHRFATRSDTEVIVHHHEERGVAGLRDLNGMFAVGLWTAADGTLVLARDRIGIKPLYWAPLPDGGIVFASEMSAVLTHPAVGRRLCSDGLLSCFFSDYVHPPFTMVQGIYKLPPGHYLTWKDGRVSEPTRFWHVDEVHGGEARGDVRTLAVQLWDRIGQAVKRQMVADVPVGVLLSGGLDSSIVATHAREFTSEPLRTFSIAFEEKSFDESSYARVLAKRIGSQHVEETLSERNLVDVVDQALGKLDEPLADPAFLPQYLLSQLAARHVKVVLGGDGGDELWAGYPTYQAHRAAPLYAAMPRPLRQRVIPMVARSLPVQDRYASLEWKIKRFALRWDDDPVRRHLRWMSSTDVGPLGQALPFSVGRQPPTLRENRTRDADALNGILKLDLTTYLPGSVLTKVDRASMAHSLEVRPPLLDNEMVDYSFSMPSHYKLRWLRTKFLLKEAARGHVPDEIIDRPKKGFGIPLRKWLRGPMRPLLDQIVQQSPLWDTGLMDCSVFRTWTEEHVAGVMDHSKALWVLLVTDRWMRREGILAP